MFNLIQSEKASKDFNEFVFISIQEASWFKFEKCNLDQPQSCGETGQSGDVYVIVWQNMNLNGQTINTNTIHHNMVIEGRGVGIVLQ